MPDFTLNKRADLGRRLTYRETDENWSKLEALANKSKRIVATLVVGQNVIEHGIGYEAAHVNFFNPDGKPAEYYWEPDPDNLLTKIIVTVPELGFGEITILELADIKINIICI